jgi:hypothetical protein
MRRVFHYSAALVAALAIYEVAFFGFGAVVRQTAERLQFYTMDRPTPPCWATATTVGFQSKRRQRRLAWQGHAGLGKAAKVGSIRWQT